MAPCLWGASRRGWAGRPDLGEGSRLASSWVGGEYPGDRGGCQGERRTPGSRAGQTTATSGADGVISLALNETDSLTRRYPLQQGRQRVPRERRMKIW